MPFSRSVIKRYAQQIFATAGIALLASAPCSAARPLLDRGQWDRYFALFARDDNVPWTTTSVRLDTYSGAPVLFRAFAVDPTDVIVAGQSRGRPLDTRTRKPDAEWHFSPPSGYHVEGSEVPVPLGTREGVFVVEARRGSAVQQVWINRTRVGLLAKSSAGGLLVYGTDLATGRPLPGMRCAFLVGSKLVTRTTDARGVVSWSARPRPSFVLADWGASHAFLSLLPQAPLPTSVVAVRVDRPVTRAGETTHIVGFVRRRAGGVYRPGSGNVHVALLAGARSLAQTTVTLDPAGAFSTELTVPDATPGGNATVLATSEGVGGGAALTIDGATDVRVSVASACSGPCSASKAVPIVMTALRNGAPENGVRLRVRVVRYPHIFIPGTLDAEREVWGATSVVDSEVTTNVSGRARVIVPAAADGLPSTLGITAATKGNGASAATRIILANSRAAVTVVPDAEQVDVGQPVGLNIRAFDVSDGAPVRGEVTVRMSHGPNVVSDAVRLDDHGRGRIVFHKPQDGTNLILAHLHADDAVANDANSVSVEPRSLTADTARGYVVEITPDRGSYKPGERATLRAAAPGGRGSAAVTISAAQLTPLHAAKVTDGKVQATVPVGNVEGDVAGMIAFVRDGSLVYGSVPLALDGPGRRRVLTVSLPDDEQAGAPLRLDMHDGGGSGLATTIVRVTDIAPTDGARFESAADVLAISGATVQDSASDDPPWHAFVSTRRVASGNIFADVARRPAQAEPPTLAAAAARVLSFTVKRAGDFMTIDAPREQGHYVVSVLRVYDDGSVGAASENFTVH